MPRPPLQLQSQHGCKLGRYAILRPECATIDNTFVKFECVWLPPEEGGERETKDFFWINVAHSKRQGLTTDIDAAEMSQFSFFLLNNPSN